MTIAVEIKKKVRWVTYVLVGPLPNYLIFLFSHFRRHEEESSRERCIDSEIWIPPEPEYQKDDIEGINVADDVGGMKWGKPSISSSLGEEWSWSFRFKDEMIGKLTKSMKANFKEHVEHPLMSMGISCSGNDGDTWVDTVTNLSWEAVSYLKPDAFLGKAVDPNLYIKVKCIATGSPKQSKVFRGLVFKKHAAHEQMPTKYRNPKLLLIRGVSSSTEEQEKGMEMIEKLNPNVVLVEETISHDIQEYILGKGMTLVLGMKQHRLETVARCTASPILSFNNLLNVQELGKCESFYFEKITEKHATLRDNGQRPVKTIMFVKGCPTHTGLTILLKGRQGDELKRIKRVVQFAVYMTYHLIRKSLYIEKAAATGPTGETIFLNCNKDLVEHKYEIVAVLGLARYSVLISRRNLKRETACLSDINFYRNFDMPIGKFMMDDLFSQNLLCGTCNELPEAHISYYAHDNKKITVQVQRLPSDKHLPGENEGKLWMWSSCQKCKGSLNSTKRVLVPIAVRGVSFGKIIDHALSNRYLWCIPFSCGHFYYGDYFHFFGLGSMIVRFKYSTVSTYFVSLPPRKVEFSHSIEGDFLQKEVEDVIREGHSMFSEVENSLNEMENKSVGSKLNLEGSCNVKEMLKKEQDQFQVDMTTSMSVNKWLYKPLYLNHIHWKLSLHAYIWDERVRWLQNVVETQTSVKKQSCFKEKKVTECGSDGVLSLKAADPQAWMWRSFSEIKGIYLEDLQRGYLPRYETSSYKKGSIIYKRITEEGSRLHFPFGTDNNYIVSDYEDELSSIIACALAFLKDRSNSSDDPNEDATTYQSLHKMSSLSSRNWCCFSFMDSDGPPENSIFDGLEWPDSSSYLHPVISMGRLADKPKYSVACLFHKDFAQLRSDCGLSELDYISSLSRCKPWDAKGGKSKSFFAKTLDDRFIIKEINKTEFCSLQEIALAYLAHLKKGHLSCFAKFLGFYQVTKFTSREKYDLMVMENITYRRNITRQYDIKGALYDRFNPATDGVGVVLLDQNLADDMQHSPLYVDSRSLWELHLAIQNDTSFLHFINVMDYSLLVGVDAENKEIVCGIIDYVRQYTADKKLENWFKSHFKVPKNHLPTIAPPEDYKKRFTNFIKHSFNDPVSGRLLEYKKVHQTLCNSGNCSIAKLKLKGTASCGEPSNIGEEKMREKTLDSLDEQAMQVVNPMPVTTMSMTTIPDGEEQSDIGERKEGENSRGKFAINMHKHGGGCRKFD
ncbi:hypothetical protein Lser_V15G12126 [Lactuca serriola]